MRVFPVILDRRPGYLTVGGTPRSLLLLPVGTSTLLSHLHSTLLAATRNPPTVLTPFEPDEAYTEAVREACPAIVDVIPAAAFARHLSRYEPSDWLLIADSRQVPARETDFGELLRGLADDTRSVRHLVQLETTSVGTQEFVQFDAEGEVCRIQRYYDGITWPFTGAIVSSLLPVASTLRRGGKELPFSSLSDLRTALAVGGVSSRDVPFTGGVFDLDDEAGLLALNELLILKSVRDRPAKADGDPPRGVGCRIHRSARIHGPAVIHDNVTIEAGAVVLGPAVLGARSVVGSRSVVAQCLVAPDTVVAPNTTQRHRLLLGSADRDSTGLDGENALRTERSGSPLTLLGERRRSIYPAVKRGLEATIVLLSLIVLSPLLALIAILVKLDSRGPIFFSDKREGKDGRTFHCLKFRTMVDGADTRQRALYIENQVDGPQFKLEKDPRLTRLGRRLRPTSLDELPQLFNVLGGQMSLVGPRPSPFRENQMCIPWRDARLSVRPGITGLWQVCRHDRASGDFHQWIYYDLLYVQLMSPWLDVKILVATVLTLGGKWCVPLSSILSPRAFHDRRRSRRGSELAPVTDLRRKA